MRYALIALFSFVTAYAQAEEVPYWHKVGTERFDILAKECPNKHPYKEYQEHDQKERLWGHEPQEFQNFLTACRRLEVNTRRSTAGLIRAIPSPEVAPEPKPLPIAVRTVPVRMPPEQREPAKDAPSVFKAPERQVTPEPLPPAPPAPQAAPSAPVQVAAAPERQQPKEETPLEPNPARDACKAQAAQVWVENVGCFGARIRQP